MLGVSQPPIYPPLMLAALSRIVIRDGKKAWKATEDEVASFKKLLLVEGMKLQSGRCAWCTLEIGEAGYRSVHREHIAPKSKHPNWTFHPLNLVLACEYCNLRKKGSLETVSKMGTTYESSEFHIVHPYMDATISDHIVFDFDNSEGVLIAGKSAKGLWTIRKLHLDSPELTSLRARDGYLARQVGKLSLADNTLVRSAMASLRAS